MIARVGYVSSTSRRLGNIGASAASDAGGDAARYKRRDARRRAQLVDGRAVKHNSCHTRGSGIAAPLHIM